MSTEATTPTAASTTATTPEAASAVAAAPPVAPAAPEKPAEKPPSAKDWNAVRQQEVRLAKRAEALKAAEKAAQEAMAERDELARLAKENPDEALKRLGLSYDDLTKRRLNARKTPEEVAREAAKAEAAKLLEEREAAAAKQREAEEAKAAEEHWQNVAKTFSDFVGKSGDAHELLRAELEADADEVHANLREMARQKPDLTIDKAADLYEGWLLEQTKRRLGLSKVKALMQPPAPAEGTKPSKDTTAPGAESGREGSGAGARTLTNGHAQERATAASTPKNANRHREAFEEEQERLRRAVALLG
jgi:hypothetical protein